MIVRLSERADVVVVGAGNAALAAAAAARQAGARVVVLEKASRAERGGNTKFSGGLFRVPFDTIDELAPLVRGNADPNAVVVEPYRKSDYLADFERICQGRFDRDLVAVLIDRAYDAMLWMAGLGVRFNFNVLGSLVRDDAGRRKIPFGAAIRALDDGHSLSDDWFRIVEGLGVDVRYEHAVVALTPASGDSPARVDVETPAGRRSLEAGAIVLGSGGFGSNPALRAQHMGPQWEHVKVRGTRHNTGEMLEAAIGAGGEPYGEWPGAHATPIDAEAPPYGDLVMTDKTNRLSYPFSVMVNVAGERFVDEGENVKLFTYAKTGRAVLAQPQGIAFQIFDAKVTHLLEPRYKTAAPIVAQTLEELADGIVARWPEAGFDRTRFLETMRTYNAAVGDGTFYPDAKDGKATRGLVPEKTNWAQRIDTPPYAAYSASCGLTFTFGGVRTDTEARVVDASGTPIAGVFGTGEIQGGFFFFNYPGGAGLVRGAVFGRIAGVNAARYASASVGAAV